VQSGEPSPYPGHFGFGPESICYGSITTGELRSTAAEVLHDALNDATVQPGVVDLSFDPDQVVDNLRFERYCGGHQGEALFSGRFSTRAYYLVRPLLGVGVRRHLQRLRLRGWRSTPFPRWPVDQTVELLHKMLLRLCIQANAGKEIPFIWFWPKGYSSCVSLTHDVETTKGRDFCPTLMDLDESFGFKSSLQLIPEERYSISTSFLETIRSRGFELNVHDLNHDGRLFANKAQFLRRAKRINQYAREFGAQGFRSGALYRNLDWYDALDFSYEMSVPNTAHLDPQSGGCCTVMPYFAGGMVEIPLTTTQDYSLFHILNDYSITLWRQQLDLIGRGHGLATFNIHPDYVIEPKARATYVKLLHHLATLRSDKEMWIALPGEVNTWWRQRAQMHLVRQAHGWAIEGFGCERAQLAYARLRGEELEYCFAPDPCSIPANISAGDPGDGPTLTVAA